MKWPCSLPIGLAALLLLAAPVRGQEQDDEPKPGSIDEKAEALFMISCGAAMCGFVPGFEWLALGDQLAQRVPRNMRDRDDLVKNLKTLQAYPRDLMAEFRREGRPQKSLALRYFSDYVQLLRSHARSFGDDGRDLLPAAMGEHTEPMKQALQVVLITGKGEDRLRAAAVLLDLVPDHAQASAIVAAELKAKDKDRRELACELAGTLRLTQADVLAALVAAVRDKDAEVRQSAAYAVGSIGPRAAGAVPGLIDLFKSGDAAYEDGRVFKYFLFGSKREIRNLALQALGKMDAAARPAVPIISGKLTNAADEMLTIRLGERKPFLDWPNELDEMLSCLAALGPVAKEAAPDLRRLVKRPKRTGLRPGYMDHFNHEELDAKGRLAATAVLLCIDPNDADALDILKNALQSKDDKTRCRALVVCATHGPRVKALIPLLLPALQNAQTGSDAAEALGKMGPLAEDAIPALVATVHVQDKFGRDSFHNFSALASIGKASVPALMKLLQHRDLAIRENAAQALGLIGRDAAPALPVLVEAAKGSKQEELPLQQHAVVALGRMKSSAAPARETLQRLLDQVRPEEQDLGRPDYLSIAWALSQLSR